MSQGYNKVVSTHRQVTDQVFEDNIHSDCACQGLSMNAHQASVVSKLSSSKKLSVAANWQLSG